MKLRRNCLGGATALLLCSLWGSGCSKHLPAAKPNTAPSTFFDWCQKEKFGTKFTSNVMITARNPNIPSGELGFVKYRAWTPCKTAPEARKFLDTTFAELRGKAEEKGCKWLGTEPHGTGLSLKYRIGHNDGALVGRCVLDDSQEMGKTVKAYFVELKLTEGVAEQ